MAKQSVETLETKLKALEQKRELRINKYIIPLEIKIESAKFKTK